MSEELKQCFKCGDSKPLLEFYKHDRMANGHLGKCKDCTRADVEARRKRLESTDPDWIEKEAERHRLKSKRYREAGRVKTTPAKLRAKNMKWAAEHPDKRKANHAVSNAIRDGRLTPGPCEICCDTRVEAHHEDYSRPLEVRWLCKAHHMARHVEINRERRLARFTTRTE